jgi:AbrB family looped-hinge helix DNA binding protein
MTIEKVLGDHKCFGSMTVNAKGQVVIPASARRELGIKEGDTILVFKAFMNHPALLLMKADTMEQVLTVISDGLAQINRIVKEQKSKRAK